MAKRIRAAARLVATAATAVILIAAAVGPAAAQDRNAPHGPSRAEQVRALVLEQREKVIAQIDAIFSRDRKTSQETQTQIAEEGDVTAEITEPEGEETGSEEPEGEEPEDGGAEGEADDEGVVELPDTGVGLPYGADGASSAVLAALAAMAAGFSAHRRVTVDDSVPSSRSAEAELKRAEPRVPRTRPSAEMTPARSSE